MKEVKEYLKSAEVKMNEREKNLTGFPQKIALCEKLLKQAEIFCEKNSYECPVDYISYIDNEFLWAMKGVDDNYYYFSFDRLPECLEKHLKMFLG